MPFLNYSGFDFQSRRFFFAYRQVYDDPNTVKTAANGGSRHDIYSVSTKYDTFQLIKKSSSTAGDTSSYQYELSNHLNTFFNSFALVCVLQAGTFCRPKNFLEKFRKIFGIFSKRRIAPRKGGSTTNFPTRKEVRMWNLIAGSFTNGVLFRSIVIRYCTMKRATLIKSFADIRQMLGVARNRDANS